MNDEDWVKRATAARNYVRSFAMEWTTDVADRCADGALEFADRAVPVVSKEEYERRRFDYDLALTAVRAASARAERAEEAVWTLANALAEIRDRGRASTLVPGVIIETCETHFARATWCQRHAAEILAAFESESDSPAVKEKENPTPGVS